MAGDKTLNVLEWWHKKTSRRKWVELEARKEKMAEKPLRCPKCRKKDIQVVETTEAISQHRIINGVWVHSLDNNEYGDIVKVECQCMECGHRWISPRGINLDNYYLDETER